MVRAGNSSEIDQVLLVGNFQKELGEFKESVTYKIMSPTLSQTFGTPKEGAETSGEVKSS